MKRPLFTIMLGCILIVGCARDPLPLHISEFPPPGNLVAIGGRISIVYNEVENTSSSSLILEDVNGDHYSLHLDNSGYFSLLVPPGPVDIVQLITTVQGEPNFFGQIRISRFEHRLEKEVARIQPVSRDQLNYIGHVEIVWTGPEEEIRIDPPVGNGAIEGAIFGLYAGLATVALDLAVNDGQIEVDIRDERSEAEDFFARRFGPSSTLIDSHLSYSTARVETQASNFVSQPGESKPLPGTIPVILEYDGRESASFPIEVEFEQEINVLLEGGVPTNKTIGLSKGSYIISVIDPKPGLFRPPSWDTFLFRIDVEEEKELRIVIQPRNRFIKNALRVLVYVDGIQVKDYPITIR